LVIASPTRRLIYTPASNMQYSLRLTRSAYIFPYIVRSLVAMAINWPLVKFMVLKCRLRNVGYNVNCDEFFRTRMPQDFTKLQLADSTDISGT
jgi:hypothetical protein